MTPFAWVASGALGGVLLAAAPSSNIPATGSDLVVGCAAARDENSLAQATAYLHRAPNKSIPILGRTDAEVQADRLLSDLWDGLDLSPEENSLIDEALWSGGQSLMRDTARMPKGKKVPIRVLGLFDSGTNLLCKTLELNFAHKGCSKQIWKHTVVTDVGQEAKHVENFVIKQKKAGVLVVALVRNPIAHMSAWNKAPYDLAPCFYTQNWTQDALRGDCSFHVSTEPSVHELQAYPKPGLVGVWNAQTKGYVELAKQHANMIVLKYEDLVLCPVSTVQRIAEVANATHLLADTISIPEAPAKHHGNPNGREEAVKKIKKSLYLKKEGAFLKNQLSKVCPALDLVAAESSNSCSETPAYDVDCRHIQ